MSKRIALATIALNKMSGGLERNIAYLANFLSAHGWDVSLFTFDLPGASSFYHLDDRVTWHKMGKTTPHERISFLERLRLILRIRRILSKTPLFSYVICFHHGLLVRYFTATLFLHAPIICVERNALSMYQYIRLSKWNLNFFLLFFIPRVIVQFPSYIQDYPRFLQSKLRVVHNPVFPPDFPNSAQREKLILSVGRHQAQKRFDLLIRACQVVFGKHRDWRLIIVGDGPLTSKLEYLKDHLCLHDHVEFQSPLRNLHPLFERATFYCQPSQWEGFPNAQAEAMAEGVIPIGFASTRGVADLIQDGINGFLCKGDESPENLAKALSIAIEATPDLHDMSKMARMITNEYSVESWIKLWNETLDRGYVEK